jgi:hypothetical protein
MNLFTVLVTKVDFFRIQALSPPPSLCPACIPNSFYFVLRIVSPNFVRRSCLRIDVAPGYLILFASNDMEVNGRVGSDRGTKHHTDELIGTQTSRPV